MTKEEKQLREALQNVMDPELNISVVDLGLVYKTKVDSKKNVSITMTLTTLGCPLFELIETEVKNKLEPLGYKNVKVTLTFAPPWSMEMLSEKAKAILGI